MLKNTDDIMINIAEKSGFQSERTFFRLFEKYVGIPPENTEKKSKMLYKPCSCAVYFFVIYYINTNLKKILNFRLI